MDTQVKGQESNSTLLAPAKANYLTRAKTVEYIRRWGGSASEAMLNPGCNFFFIDECEGLISYKIENNTAVVLGDPVCAEENYPILVTAFHHFCKEHAFSIVYVTATPKFKDWIEKEMTIVSLEVGEELALDPHNDPAKATGVNASLVRRKMRHAQKEDVVIKEYDVANKNEELEQAIEKVGEDWLKQRNGPQIYISQIRLFNDRFGKRWFYAEQNGKVVGIVLINKLEKMKGWLLNRIMVTSDAPNGTPELLVETTLNTLEQEGCHFISFGIVPLEKIGKIEGLQKFYIWLIEKIYSFILLTFRLGGRKKFWEKFHPISKPSYLLFCQPITYKELKGMSKALNVSM